MKNILKKESTYKTILKYSSSNVYRRILGVFSILIKPKFLSPEYYGILNLINLIPRYTIFLDLGTREAMRYLIPTHLQKNEADKVEDVKKTVFFGTLLTHIPVAIAIACVGLFCDLKIEMRVGLAAMSAVVMITWYEEFWRCVLMSQEKFSFLTKTYYIDGTVSVITSIVLVILMNIYGAYLSSILSEIAILCYIWYKLPLEIKGSFNRPLFWSLVKNGIIISTFGLSMTLIRTSDRLIISLLMGNESLGHYSIAIMIINALMLIPGASREVLEPKLVKNMVENSMAHSLNNYLFKPILNSSYYLPFLIGPFFFFLPAAVPLLFPKYMPGIVPAQILIMGTYYLAMSYLMRGFVIAHRWHFKILGIMAANLLFSTVLITVLIKLGFGLAGAAMGGSISNFALFLSLYIFIMMQCRVSQKTAAVRFLNLLMPFLMMLLLCVGIDRLFFMSKLSPIAVLSAELLLYLFAMSAFILIAKKFIPSLSSFKDAEDILKNIDTKEDLEDAEIQASGTIIK